MNGIDTLQLSLNSSNNTDLQLRSSSSSNSSSNENALVEFRQEIRKDFESTTEIFEASRFVAYLRGAVKIIQNRQGLRLVMNTIEEELHAHVEVFATILFGEKMERIDKSDKEKKAARMKFVKNFTINRSDATCKMGNKIIDFIDSFKLGTFQKNYDFQHASIALADDSAEKDQLMTAVSTISGILERRELIDEKLHLALSNPRNCVTTKADQIYSTITEKPWNDGDEIDLTEEDLSNLELTPTQKSKTIKVFGNYKRQVSQLLSTNRNNDRRGALLAFFGHIVAGEPPTIVCRIRHGAGSRELVRTIMEFL